VFFYCCSTNECLVSFQIFKLFSPSLLVVICFLGVARFGVLVLLVIVRFIAYRQCRLRPTQHIFQLLNILIDSF
jgi:hypothetical protein